MKHRKKISLIAGACLVLSLVASSFILHRTDQLRPQATLDEVLFLNSPKVIKRASLGFDGLVACIYWTRAVQYFGSRFRYAEPNYSLLAPLLEITTQLDPHLVVAYDFGSTFLASKQYGAGEPERAIELTNYGIQHNPDNWRLYYDLGFIYYMELKDYKNAADAFERGSRVPNAHPFVKILAAQMAQHAGEYQTSRMLWSATFQTTHDKQIKQSAFEHLRALRVDEDVTHLQDGVTHFGERTGRLPASMAELLAAMGLDRVPVDPDGHPYKLTPEGRVEVRVPDDYPFATKGLPPGYKPPPKFHSQP
jgi:tetratricopeptide (TPR) repeat protein